MMNPECTAMPLAPHFGIDALHGRDDERDLLRRVLERIQATGTTEIVMISGGGGAGKSTLARWLLRQAQRAASPVGEGKCDQLNVEIPFAAIAQIVRMLTLDALGGEQAALDELSARWRELLSGQGNLVTELVPEAEHVLGGSGPAPGALTPQGQVRIERALLRTLEAFSRLGRPAVVFLDDLQWADEATLSFLKAFILSPPSNVLFIGAYRDNHGTFPQWYSQAKHANRSAVANFHDVTVPPLSRAAFRHIVTDALEHSSHRTESLADMLHHKSGGNPYFAQQLLQSWMDDGVLKPAGGGWEWAEAEIESSGYADQVVDLIIQRIARLPDRPKRVLQHLACIGMHCESTLLAHVCGLDAGAFSSGLEQLLACGLLVRQGDACAFQHDRVLEAAYALIAPADKSPAHAHVARRMMTYRRDEVASAAYEIGNQIEKILPKDIVPAEKPGFVRILLAAARRAQRASAVDRARHFHKKAKSLMAPSWWETHYALAYEAALIECECLIAKAELAEASACIDAILLHDLSGSDRAPVHRLEAVLYTLRSDYEKAIDAALAGLGILGVRLDRDPGPAELRAAYDAATAALNGRGIASLAGLPLCQDRKIRDAMALLSTLISSFFAAGDIRFTHLAKLVELTLRHGVSPDSPYGLAWFGVFIASYYDRFEDGYAFGLAALDLVERHGFESARIATLVALDQVAVWTQPLEVALDYVQQASTRGVLSGDLGMACYACNHIVSDMLAMGTMLPLVEEAAEYGIALTGSIGYLDIELLIRSQLDLVTVLTKGYTLGDQGRWMAECNARASSATSLPTKFWVWLYAGLSAAFRHQWEPALAFLARAMPLAMMTPAHINVADCHLFHALALSRSRKEDRETVSAVLHGECARFALWTRHNERTFGNKLQLLQGELARVEGNHLQALMYFEMASRTAGAAGFVHEQALAHELAAMVCDEHALDIAGARHWSLAKAAYLRWGARHKADSIHADDVSAGAAAPAANADAGERQDSSALQFGLRAAHALSQESVKEKLVETMFADLLAEATAQYGVLIKITDGVPMIEASGRLTKDGIVTSVAVVAPDQSIIPMRLLSMVLRTQRSVIIHDALNEVLPIRGQREQGGALRSVLCLPLLRAGELVGLLYMENNLAPGVFNPARVLRLELMASQIAIALGFARLYEQLIAANRARTEAETHLHVARAELVRNVHRTVLANLAASIAHEINQPLGAIVISAEAALRWLNRGEPEIERIQAGLQRIRTDGLRAAGIIRALRGLAAKNASDLEKIQVAGMVSGVVAMLSDDFAAKDIEIGLLLEPDAVVIGDRVQLQQVILNLLNNAAEAMLGSPDCLRRRLQVATRMTDRRLTISIRDSGPGIAEDRIERIFEPFYTTKENGLGMGLAICVSIAEAHGGTLAAVNHHGGGTSFILDIPADSESRG